MSLKTAVIGLIAAGLGGIAISIGYFNANRGNFRPYGRGLGINMRPMNQPHAETSFGPDSAEAAGSKVKRHLPEGYEDPHSPRRKREALRRCRRAKRGRCAAIPS